MSTIDTPLIADSPEMQLALLHLTVPRAEIMTAMPPAFSELEAVLKTQNIPPAGPWFAHYLQRPTEFFDFEICSPINTPIEPTGRLTNGKLRATKVLRTVHHGPYEGLVAAWREFMAWVDASRHTTAPDLWETYLSGPFNNPDPATWRTELNVPLLS